MLVTVRRFERHVHARGVGDDRDGVLRPQLVELARIAAEPTSAALTRRELDVLRLLADGATNRRIAGTLGIAPSTVGTHVEHIFAKLGVTDRSEAIVRARREGFGEP